VAPQREWFDKNYYEVLGVSETAPPKDITRAYRKLAREFHPDANPGNAAAEDKFKEISAAYDVVGDETKRAEYDEVRLAICLVACSAAVAEEVARTKVVDAHRNAAPISRQHFGCHSVKRSTVWKLRFTSPVICPVEHVAVPVQSQEPGQRCVSTVVEAASPTTTRACSRSHLLVPYAVVPVRSSRPHAEPVALPVSKSVRAKSRFAFLPASTRVNASS